METGAMAKLKAISEKIVAALQAPEMGNQLHYASGLSLQGKKAPSGFAVRVTSAGTKSFVWFHRVDGKPYWETLGRWDENAQGGTLTVRDAIIAADRRAKLVAKGIDAKGNRVDPRPERTRRLDEANQPSEKNIAGVLDMFVSRYVVGKLRSERIIRQSLDRLVKPRIGKVGIYDLKRSQVSKMLDEIADEHGEVMADRTLSYVRKAFSWYEINSHDDDFRSPVVRGMARTKPSEHARDRILTDDEIRSLWKVAAGPFGPMLRFILLTACRRSEAAGMTRSEVVGDDWTIPAARCKTKTETVLPLSKAAQDVLATLPKGTDYIFTTTGEKPIAGFTQFKAKVDEQCGFSDWTIHDLRRTARSLMSRAGVPTDHAERCLGHVMPGVRGIYDRHAYLAEKRAAFEALAALVFRILNPTANVEELAARRLVQS
jgi:integrase